MSFTRVAELLKNRWIGALLCAALAFAAFSPVLRAGFVWDDGIIWSYQLPYFKTIGDAFKPPPQLTEWSKVYYRPVVVLTYMAEDRLTGATVTAGTSREDPRRAAIPHAVSLLLHALATGAVTLLAARLLKRSPHGWLGAIAAGLFFGLLPVHAETACWISGRSDSLATLFLLASILVHLEAAERRSPALFAASGAAFLAALLSKEVAAAGFVLLPAALFLSDSVQRPRSWKGWATWLAPYGAAFAVFLALRFWAGAELTASGARPGGESVPAVLKALPFYLSSVVAFWRVLPYPAELPSAISALAWLSVGFAIVVGAVVAWLRGVRYPALCLFWFLSALAPALAVLFNNSASIPVAQRYLYLPSVGLAIAVGFAAAAITGSKFKNASRTTFALAFAIFFALSLNAATTWRDDKTFWKAVVENETAARHAMPWVNLGAAHLYAGEYEEADRYFLKALNPGVSPPPAHLAMAYTNLGVSRMERAFAAKLAGNIGEAERLAADAQRYMDAAVGLKLADWTLYKNNAQCLLLRAEFAKARTGAYDGALLEAARQHLQKAAMFSPGNAEVMEQFAIYSRYAAESGRR